MAWGGSLNREGSEYLKEVVKAESAIEFLDRFKSKLDSKGKEIVNKTINLISNYYSK